MQSIDNVNPTIHLAIELSASSWLIAARLPGSEKSHLHRIDGGNTAALLALISSLRAHVARWLDVRLGLSAALRPVVTGSGCIVCLQRMASPTMYSSPPASSSTAVPDEPRRTGSTR
jgi:hypothetical protein